MIDIYNGAVEGMGYSQRVPRATFDEIREAAIETWQGYSFRKMKGEDRREWGFPVVDDYNELGIKSDSELENFAEKISLALEQQGYPIKLKIRQIHVTSLLFPFLPAHLSPGVKVPTHTYEIIVLDDTWSEAQDRANDWLIENGLMELR